VRTHAPPVFGWRAWSLTVAESFGRSSAFVLIQASVVTVILKPVHSLSSALPRSSTDRCELNDELEAVPDRAPYLLAQVREAFGHVVYSHKTHEKQADI